MKPRFFATPAAWRAWLERNHATADELLVGFWKRGSGEPSITWPESVDGALCFGWIDGVRRRIDDERYTIRFTPRRARSIWSAVNIARIAELAAAELVHPAGRAVFEARDLSRAGKYSHENRSRELPPELVAQFAANAAAWTWFRAQAPSYQRAAIWHVVSAVREATRTTRLARLIADSAAQRRLPHLTPRLTR